MPKKIALCVGQNEYSAASGVSPLRGCVNDAVLIGELLRSAGFSVRQVHDRAAVQKAILQRLEVEVAKLRDGDHLVFWNSSHGYQVRDRAGDELYDYLDEAICSYDTDVRDPLTDDKLSQIVSRAHPGAIVFVGSDSCHSGTLTRGDVEGLAQNDDRLPRLYVPPDDIVFRSGGRLINLDAYLSDDASEATARQPGRTVNGSDIQVRRFGRLRRDVPEGELNHVLLSGCKSEQVSWDAKFPQGFHGAMTYHFARAVLRAWREGRAISYGEVHEGLADTLHEAGYEQDPQLEGPESLKDRPVFGYGQ